MKDQVIKAIGAHGLWKARLKSSVDAGCIEMDAATIEKDNLCEFGKWLYSDGLKGITTDPNYQKIKSLHADFHKVVAKVLRFIEQGNNAAATEMMSMQGEYTLASQKLVEALMDWSKKL